MALQSRDSRSWLSTEAFWKTYVEAARSEVARAELSRSELASGDKINPRYFYENSSYVIWLN